MTIESIRSVDPQVYEILRAEEKRQRDSIRLIASENYTSEAVLAAVGSVFSNKYSEGYPGRRYYQGQANTDAVEKVAIVRARDLFGADRDLALLDLFSCERLRRRTVDRPRSRSRRARWPHRAGSRRSASRRIRAKPRSGQTRSR